MAGYSPFPAGAPGLVPISGPNGTFMVPEQVGGAFGVQGAPPIAEPLPTFDPTELAPPPVVSTQPAPAVPQPFALTDEEAAQFTPPPPPAAPPPRPGTIQSQLANVEQARGVAHRQGMVDADVADREAAAMRLANQEDERLSKERDAERQRYKLESDEAKAKQSQALDQFVNHKVDQNRAWHDMGTGRQIAAAIGIALSGIGGALVARDTGRPVTNPALDMMTAAIDRDVRLQLADRDKLGAAVGMRRSAVDDLRQSFNDSEAQYSAMMGGRTKILANKLAEIGATAKAPTVKLQAERTGLALNEKADAYVLDAQARQAAADEKARDNKRADDQLGLAYRSLAASEKRDERDTKENNRRWEAEHKLAMGKAELAAKAAEAKGDPALAKELREEARDEAKRVIPGMYTKAVDGSRKPLVARTEEEAKKIRDSKAAGEKLLSLVDENMRLIDKHGGESAQLKGDTWQKVKSNEAAILNGLRKLESMGTLDASAIEVGKQQLGGVDPTSFVRNARAGYGQFRKQVLGTVNTLAQGQDENAEYYDVPEATLTGVLGESSKDPAFQAAFKQDDKRNAIDHARDALLLRAGAAAPATEATRVKAGIEPGQQQAIEMWARAYNDPWAPASKKEQAAKYLKGWSLSSDPKIGAYAKARAKELGIAVPE